MILDLSLNILHFEYRVFKKSRGMKILHGEKIQESSRGASAESGFVTNMHL
jgi:hypothetical protein